MQFSCDCGEVWRPKSIDKEGMSAECAFCGKVPSMLLRIEEAIGFFNFSARELETKEHWTEAV